MSTKNCRTCRWAKWEMTKHKTPRVNVNLLGRCLYPAERIALPMAFRGVNHLVLARVDQTDIGYIAPENPYTNCRVWEKSQ